jgi:hypothetical protein
MSQPTYSGVQTNAANGGAAPAGNAPAWQQVAHSGGVKK